MILHGATTSPLKLVSTLHKKKDLLHISTVATAQIFLMQLEKTYETEDGRVIVEIEDPGGTIINDISQ